MVCNLQVLKLVRCKCSCKEYFASARTRDVFKFKDVEGYKGRPVSIQFKDNHPVVMYHHRLSLSKREGRCDELLLAALVEFSNGEYAFATTMPPNEDNFGNWTEKRMFGDY